MAGVAWTVLAAASSASRADTEMGAWVPDDIQPKVLAQRPKVAYTKLEFDRVHETANAIEPEYASGDTRLLIDAARRGNMAEVAGLLKQGVNPNALPDLTGKTALMEAIDRNDVVMVRRLLDAGADPDQLAGHFRPLGRAALLGYSQIADLLLKHGANPDLKSKDGNTPLTAAADMNRVDVVRRLVAARPDYTLFDDRGLTALSEAALGDHVEVLRAMLEAGADPNLPNKRGTTPLSLVAGPGHEKVQALLVKFGGETR